MTKARALLWRVGRGIVDLVLPPHCPTCEEPVADDLELCAGCFRQASFVVDPCCALCAVPFASDGYAGAARHCSSCLRSPPAWDQARAAFVYDAFSRRLILPLKYADRVENAAVLGAHMKRAGAELLAQADVIVPVPLHRARLRARRYNQSVLLARASIRGGRGMPLLLPDGLVRHRATVKLAARSAGERRRELKGAIAVHPSHRTALLGARVVLIDDVLTTGSTASECTVELRQAGASSVALLVAARTPPRLGEQPLSCAADVRTLADTFEQR